MSNILDLSVIQPKNWTIKLPNEDEFIIPGSISLGVVLELENDYNKISKNNDNKESYNFMKNTLIKILKLDKEKAKKINDKYIVDNNLDSIQNMTAIVEGFIQHVTNIKNDENLNSPQN